MKNILIFAKKKFAIIFIFILWLTLVVANFSSSTWLSGWDNLHPEFDFAVNLKRALFSSWQEYQGLGLLGGMGHASDLFRQLILRLVSFVLPLNSLRYFFHFSMLLTGALGIYLLLKDFILEKHGETTKKWGAVIGAVFYLLNLGTLQMFYIPLEVFSTHFGFLPWLFWGVLRYLKDASKKNLLILLLINLLSISQGYVATVFVVYFLALTFVLLFYFIFTKHDFKKLLIIFLLTVFVNTFWLIPNLYFLVTSVDTNTGAKINLMSTENNLLLNKKYGDLGNTVLLRGFLFNSVELQSNGSTGYVMGGWIKHSQNPYISGMGYLLFGLSLLGIIFAFKTKNKKALLFLPVFLLGFTFLANDAFGFSFLNKLLYKLPLFSQIFRFPFTKFSILTAFCLAVFYGVFAAEAIRVAETIRIGLRVTKGFTCGIVIFFILLPMVFLFPVFQGKLFYAKERVKIPDEYFEVFDFFKREDKNTRIADFPQPTFWGWTNYRWDKELYSGSGFVWYGIEQPILDRAFDVWSKQNENYYWEISYALYSKNREFFEKVLEKYQVNWLLVDGNVINPDSGKALFLDELENMLQDEQINKKVELVTTFGKIKIYKFNLQAPIKDYVYLASNLASVNSYEWGNNDKAFEELGDYASTDNLEVYYPFRSIFTGRKSEEITFEIEELKDKFIFKTVLPKEITNYELIIPPYKGDELVSIDGSDLSKMKYLIPVAEIKEGKVEVAIPKATGLLSAEIDPTKNPEALKSKNCNQFNPGKGVSNTVVSDEENQKDWLRLEAQDANNCSASFYLPNLMHQYGYLIGTESRNIFGKTLLFWLENMTNPKADLEMYLSKNQNQQTVKSWFIQPPMAKDGLGYTLHFDNISIGKEKTINDLGKISVYQIPYQFLTGIRLEKNLPVNLLKIEQKISVLHPNPSLYKVQIDNNVNENTTLVLSQSYHQGWKAYEVKSNISSFIAPIFGQEIKDHVLVNNWENGWTLPGNFKGEIVIIFWPQYLEYLGFGILGATLILIIFSSKTLRKTQ